jgi:uncharacterized protein (UPF0335 family)
MAKAWEYLPVCAERFGQLINEAADTDTIEGAIYKLNKARDYITKVEQTVREMKQVEHDLTQDVFNKFKNSGFVKTIKF